jgi:hypothetical protein
MVIARPKYKLFRLSEELDRDLRRNLIHRPLNLFSSLGEPVGVDVDSNAAPRTGHVFVGFEPPNCLLELMPTIRTLKPDLVRINLSHQRNGPLRSRERRRPSKSDLNTIDALYQVCRRNCQQLTHITKYNRSVVRAMFARIGDKPSAIYVKH